MKILIFNINYAPELTGVGKYTGDMGAWLAGQGHTVEVITAMPYYPEWKVGRSYKGKTWFTEVIDGVTVHRCPLYVPQRVTPQKRILHELSFVLSSLPFWLLMITGRSFDRVICVGPPFHIAMLPLLYARLKKIPLWLHLQDLQIDMAKEMGMLKHSRLLSLLFRLESFLLKRATQVSTISEGMVRKIEAKNVLQTSCLLFPNWVEHLTPVPVDDSLRTRLGLNTDDKVVLYSGSLGEKQGLELILEAARHFVYQPNVRFVICGAGSGKERLQQLANAYQLANVTFIPLQPYHKLGPLLSTADVHLVLQKKNASDLVLPSKLTNILAVGGLALVTAVPESTLYELIDGHKMGMLVEPESVEALIDGLTSAFQADWSVHRTNALQYARQHLNRERILSTFHDQLIQLPTHGLRFSNIGIPPSVSSMIEKLDYSKELDEPAV